VLHLAGVFQSPPVVPTHVTVGVGAPATKLLKCGSAAETVCAWKVAIENRHRPTVLALTRQNVPTLDRSAYATADGLTRGAYVLNPGVARPDVILLATGSEVQHIVAAEQGLARQGVQARLVSMPCWELFDEQPADYRDSVLPPSVAPRLAVEAGVSLGWHRWVGPRGATLSVDRFGASAPGSDVMRALGFTAENVAERALGLLPGR